MTRAPDFDDLVGRELPDEERARLLRAHQLLIEAGPPPELSPELDSASWLEESQTPLLRPKRRRPLLLAAALATAIVIGFVLGQSTSPSSSTSSTVRVVNLAGTKFDRDARASLELGKADASGNWPMLLHARGLQQLPEGGYYDLYLTKGGKPVVLCGTFNVKGREIIEGAKKEWDSAGTARTTGAGSTRSGGTSGTSGGTGSKL